MTVVDIIILARGHEGLVVNGVCNCNRGLRKGATERPRIVCFHVTGWDRQGVKLVLFPKNRMKIQFGIKFRRNEEGEEFK